MAKTGCIAHPQHSRLALLREEYVRLCGGSHCAAMILAQMEYWHNVKIEAAAQAEAHNEAARRGGEEPSQDTELWVYKSLPEMKEELLGLFGDKAVSAGYALLIEREYLEWRTNPRFAWDRTRQYRFNASRVQAELDRAGAAEPAGGDAAPPGEDDAAPAARAGQGAELPPSKAQNCGLDVAELPLPSRKDAAAIPEMTPKITNKEKKQTLNVGPGVNSVANRESTPPRNGYAEWLDKTAAALVAELQDVGSERRHRQLLSVCDQHRLYDLPKQALQITRQRLARENRRGVVERPGAYYTSVLLKLLEERQVFVPTAGEDDPNEVRRLIQQSLGPDC